MSNFIKNALKFREYQPPVIHLEFLSKNELNLAMQIIDSFEGAGVAFGAVYKHGKKTLALHLYGLMSEKEKSDILDELRSMSALAEYKIIVD